MWIFLGVSAAVAAGIFGRLVLRFARTRREALRRLADGGRVAETAKGPVEYARAGDGPVVLTLHGGMGGYDQGLVIAERWLGLVEAGFSVLSPSRPGYLGTPVEVGRTPEEAADAMAALLDALGIERALVVGTSGGGPTALQLALRHPDRTEALVLFSAITGRHVQPGRTSERWGWVLFSRYGAWLLDLIWWVVVGMVKRFPRLMVESMFKATSIEELGVVEAADHVMSHPEALASLQALMDAQVPLSPRKPGLDNDLGAFASLPVYPVERIACPTLIVHGKLDGNVPFSHAERVAGAIPDAELHAVEDGSHLLCAHPAVERVRAAVWSFLRRSSEGGGPRRRREG